MNVREAFDAEALKEVCRMNDKEIQEKYGLWRNEWKASHDDNFYLYKSEPEANILFVAHLDSVQDERWCDVVELEHLGPLVYSPVLDDRLGAYVGLELLPKLGVKADWLLTTGEECGRSTAGDFWLEEGSKQYNWLFQFDRTGDDVVVYDYRDKKWEDAIEAHGPKTAWGSFSDICKLQHLGCKAANWGVGYKDYHSIKSHAWLDVTFSMVESFLAFYEAQHEVHWPHEKKKSYSYSGGYGFSGRSFDNRDNLSNTEAAVLGKYQSRHTPDRPNWLSGWGYLSDDEVLEVARLEAEYEELERLQREKAKEEKKRKAREKHERRADARRRYQQLVASTQDMDSLELQMAMAGSLDSTVVETTDKEVTDFGIRHDLTPGEDEYLGANIIYLPEKYRKRQIPQKLIRVYDADLKEWVSKPVAEALSDYCRVCYRYLDNGWCVECKINRDGFTHDEIIG